MLTMRRKGKDSGSPALGKKGRFYRKSLIMFLIVSGMPGLIIGALIYGIAGGKIEKELLQLHNRQIEQRAKNMDDQLSNLELMLSHWAFDPKFDYSLGQYDFIKDYERARDITKTLLVMQGSNTMVKNVELFLDGNHSILFDPEYSTLGKETSESTYGPLIRVNQPTYWTQWAFERNRSDRKDLTLVHHIPGGSQEPFGALLVRLDPGKVSELLAAMTPYSGGETFLKQDNLALYASTNESNGVSPFAEELMKRIGLRSESQASFIMEWQGESYTVSYGSFNRIAANWTYVSASPISGITAPVVLVSKLIIGISMISLLLAAVLAWLASRSIYSPVDRLLQLLLDGKKVVDQKVDEFQMIEHQWHSLNRESSNLNQKLNEQLTHVRESFLHQLMQGYLYAYSEADLLLRMERYNWQVRDKSFIVMFVRFTGIAGEDRKFKNGDEGLATFAAVNMIEDLAKPYFEQSNGVNFHDLTAALLIMVERDTDPSESIRRFGDELTLTINQILKMRVTLAIGKAVANVSDIPLAFEAAKQAASYRAIGIENQLIELEKQGQQGEYDSEFQYPFTLERELIQAVRTGKEEEAKELLTAFLEALSQHEAKVFDVQQGMLHLLGSVQHAILVSGLQPSKLFKGVNLYEQLSMLREPEVIVEWFQEKVITPFLTELAGRSDAQVKRLIEQAMVYLQENYRTDISLDNCAEFIGCSPFFLSKTFKQVTGKNFIDYLTELRLERAKELLRESELKINDVADQVGYQHSYFNRIFKKAEGMTPTRYRELSRNG